MPLFSPLLSVIGEKKELQFCVLCCLKAIGQRRDKALELTNKYARTYTNTRDAGPQNLDEITIINQYDGRGNNQ